jgi:hypothetical protein
MIKISLVVFLLVLQALLLSMVLAVFALFRVRRLTARLAGRHATSDPGPGVLSDAAHYLAMELQHTRGRLDGLGGVPASGAADGAVQRLAWRAEWLQMEAEWAGQTEHDDAAWNRLDERLQALFRQGASAGLAPPPSASVDQDEAKTKRLFDEQRVTLEQLKAQLAAAVTDPDKSETLQQQLDRLGHTARELTFCVTILEDENLLLHNQVRALQEQ